jgi:hypothetical protein
MTAVLIYSAIALLMLAAVVFLARSRQAGPIQEIEICSGEVGASWEGPDLSLAERIFDRTDYLWLRDQVGFAPLAESLLRSRTQMALQWLRAVRRSLDKLVRTPGDAPGTHNPARARESWHLLRLTLRFHLIVGYAILVVRLFGPYHRLIPSFGWMPSLFVRPSTSDAYESADVPRFS